MRDYSILTFELYFAGDLAKYHESIILKKLDDKWVLEISYCTPKIRDTRELQLSIKIATYIELRRYIRKLTEITYIYRGLLRLMVNMVISF